MGQKNADTVQFKPWETVNDSVNSNTHVMQEICRIRESDTVDIWDVDPVTEEVHSVIASNLTILSINPGNNKVVFSAPFDSSSPTGTVVVNVQNIDDSQQAIERALCDPAPKSSLKNLQQAIEAFEADSPSAGKGLYDVDDSQGFRPGDEVEVVNDTGVVIASTTIHAIDINADDANNKSTIAVNSNVDPVIGQNPIIRAKALTLEEYAERLQERIDEIDKPVKNKLPIAQPDSTNSVFEFPVLFLSGSSDVFIDGSKKHLGDCGTLSELVQGALPNGQVTFTSMILNTFGDQTRIEVVNAAGLTVSVTGNHKTGFLVQVNNNSGAATAKQICDAINADADAKKVVQAIYSGDGSTALAAFGPTNLAGGADDATLDYCELEQVFENKRTGTGFKFVSFNIRPDHPNRMNKAPKDSEEIVIGYAKALVNQDR